MLAGTLLLSGHGTALVYATGMDTEFGRIAGLTLDHWREIQPVLHDEFALLVEEAYHETNRWLVEHKVLAEVDLRAQTGASIIALVRDRRFLLICLCMMLYTGAEVGSWGWMSTKA